MEISMIDLLFRVIVISVSGALAPGPLTAATASAGVHGGWRSGIKTAFGHMVVEVPLVVLLSLGIAAILKNRIAVLSLGIMGSIFLFLFGISTLRDAALKNKNAAIRDQVRPKKISPFLTGVALSALNPYFIAWWIGIGAPLISDAFKIAGFFGVGIMYISHVWLDYAWLAFIASIASLGRLQSALYHWIMIILGATVIGFGVNMLIRTIFT